MRHVSWSTLISAGAAATLLVICSGTVAAAADVPLASGPSALLDIGVADDDEVTTIVSAGTYRFTGFRPNGRIVVDAADSGIVRLILDTVNITSATGPPIEVRDADEVIVVLAAGSTNVLTDDVAETDPDTLAGKSTAALFSAADLTITGTGSLTVNSRGHDGIVSEKGLVVDSGTIVVNAKNDGLQGTDYLVVKGGTVTVTSGRDGMKATNENDPTLGYVAIAAGTITITAGENGVKAKSNLIVTDGNLSISSGGGNTVTILEEDSAKGLSARVSIVIGGGRITVDSADTAIHSKGSISVSGGTLSLKASVGSEADGIHADDALDIFAGTITVATAYEGLEAVKLTISGGVIATVTANDGLNAAQHELPDYVVAPNAFINVRGGTMTVTSTGDDGIDSNGTIAVSGGDVVVDSVVDGIDTNGTLLLSGGTVVVNGAPVNNNFQDGVGASSGLILNGGTLLSAAISASSTPPATTSTQGWASLKLDTPQPAGTIIQLVSGTTVTAAYQSARTFQSVLLTSDKITNGRSYDVYIGGRVSGTNIGGMYPSGDLTGARRVATIEAGRFVVTTMPRPGLQ